MAELFLAEEPIEAAELAAAIRRTTLANKFAPVFMGSAYKNKGESAWTLEAFFVLLPGF